MTRATAELSGAKASLAGPLFSPAMPTLVAQARVTAASDCRAAGDQKKNC